MILSTVNPSFKPHHVVSITPSIRVIAPPFDSIAHASLQPLGADELPNPGARPNKSRCHATALSPEIPSIP